jgi:hypothetical protein
MDPKDVPIASVPQEEWDGEELRKSRHVTWAETVRVFRQSPHPKRNISYTFGVLLILAIGVGLALMFGDGRPSAVFGKVFARLPLWLPIIALLQAVMLAPERVLSTKEFLRLSNPVSLGLVSFGIWYLVTAQGTPGYIRVNDNEMLNAQYAVLFCWAAFIWAGFCSVISVLADTRYPDRGSWMLFQFLVLVLTLAALRIPFGMLEKREDVEKRIGVSLDVKSFTVTIAYRDPSLNAYLGRSTSPIEQSVTYHHISAKTLKEARAQAMEKLKRSELIHQFSGPAKGRVQLPPKDIEIIESAVVGQEE